MDVEPCSESSATIGINEVEVEVDTSDEKYSLSDIAHYLLLTGLYPDDITDKPRKLSIHKQKDGMIPINRAVCFASSEDEDSAVMCIAKLCLIPEGTDNMAYCPRCKEWYHQKCERIPLLLFDIHVHVSAPSVHNVSLVCTY